MMEVQEAILRYIDQNKQKLLKLCSDLIKAGGENPPGDVSKVSSVIEEFLTENEIKYERIEPKPGKVNLIASVGEGAKKFIVCGHMDVVPAGDISRWSFHPFCGKIEDGRILGRGSTDMKGGLSSLLMALSALKKFDEEVKGEVKAIMVCDEETGGEFGAKWLIEHGKFTGDACLIAEPTAYEAAGYTIGAGERGVWWIRLVSLGKPAHGSWPMMGDNAILKLSSFLPKLREVEKIEVKVPKDAEEIIRNGKRILAMIAEKVGIPADSLTWILDHYTFNVGTIVGGTKTNVVPERCEAEIDFRIPIGGSKEELESKVREIIPDGIAYEEIQEAEPSYSSINEPLLRIVKEKVREIFDVDVPLISNWATTDAWRIRKIGIPTIIFGPGVCEKAHSYDEYVLIQDLVKASKAYASIIASYLSL